MLDDRTRQFLADHPVPPERLREIEAGKRRLESAAALERARREAAGEDAPRRVTRPLTRLGGGMAYDRLQARLAASQAALAARRAAFAGHCWQCQDTGPCRACDRGIAEAERLRAAADAAALDTWLSRAGLTARQRRMRFDTLPAQHPSLAAVERFVNRWDGVEWLLLYGPYGVGKTGAVCAALGDVADAMRQRGQRALFVAGPDLYAGLRAGYDGGVVPDYRGVDLLVIDDLGAAKQTAWADEALFALVNARLENERATWFTSNLAPEALLGVVGERVWHRIMQCARLIEMSGPNLRAL